MVDTKKGAGDNATAETTDGSGIRRNDAGRTSDADAPPNAYKPAPETTGRTGAAPFAADVGTGDDTPTPTSMPIPQRPTDSDSLAQTDPSIVLAVPRQESPSVSPKRRPTSPGSAPARGADPTLNRYIDSLHLAELDLSEVELPATGAPSLPTLMASAALAVALIFALAVLPTTALYQLHGTGELLFWVLAAALVGTLAFASRHVGALSEASSFELPQGPDLSAQRRSIGRVYARLQTKLRRYGRVLMLASIAGLAALIIWVLPRDAEWQGGSYSSAWFLAVIVAMSCGVLVGRFILVQAEATPLSEEVVPFVLPSWFRWVTLTLLIAGGLTASFGASWFGLGGPGSSGEFSLAGLGLVVGIGGAIWLARRFDELEIKWREETDSKHAAQAFDDPAQNGQMGKKP